MVDGVLLSPQWRQTVMGGIRRGLEVDYAFIIRCHVR